MSKQQKEIESALFDQSENDEEKVADKKLRDLNANELVIAVVGPVGSGTSRVATDLEGLLGNDAYHIDAHIIKASEVIKKWAAEQNKGPSPTNNSLQTVTFLQDAGDQMRKQDQSAVALALISSIRDKREEVGKRTTATVTAITPQLPTEAGNRRVYILDSLKHPSEVELLRAVYKEAFCLIGVVCEEEIREARLTKVKCRGSSINEVQILMKRDEDAEITHGQKVADTFHLSDFFVNNSPSSLSGFPD